MPAKKTVKQTFLLGQPLFRAAARKRLARWQAIIAEAEPRDKRRESGFVPAFTPPGEKLEGGEHSFRRINRAKLIAGLADPPEAWRRVALICGAGLGKTTNLRWLEAAMNGYAEGRGKQLAFFLELEHLPLSPEKLLEKLLGDMQDRVGASSPSAERLKLDLERRRQEGRITLLLDSLDQAGSSPKGHAVQAVRKLLKGEWALCPIWVSGRPSAFAQNDELFCEEYRWIYLRVGQLDEPETRFLLEATREEKRRRRRSS